MVRPEVAGLGAVHSLQDGHRLPPINECRYPKDWVAVKIRWGLSMDSSERTALKADAADCTNSTITVTVRSG